MIEKRVSISDAAKQLSVEAHVLRYWELELGLTISRNAQGHRFYKPEDILLLKQIKYLKEQGFRLQAIKLLLTDINNTYTMDKESLWELRDQLNGQVLQEEAEQFPERHTAQIMPLHPKTGDSPKPYFKSVPYEHRKTEEKWKQFEDMMRNLIRSTLEDLTAESEERICEKITTRVLKELNYLEIQRGELQEKQLALLQDILAEIKREGSEAAATSENLSDKRHGKKKRERKKKLFAKSSE